MNTTPKTLIQYVRHPKTNSRVGIVVAYRDGDEIKIGWSVAHIPLDKFNKQKGLSIALERARTGYTGHMPAFVIPTYEAVIDRANRYYKISLQERKSGLSQLLNSIKLW